MIIETLLAIAVKQSDWPLPAELQKGEVLRVYERTMSRQGIFERVLVLTPNKVFMKDVEKRNWAMLTRAQQSELKSILASEPAGLRSSKRPNPMWPSTYDGSDQWMAYRVGQSVKTWTNREYEYPSDEAPLAKFIQAIRTQLGS
jgi:hypothetical protein